MTVIFSSMAALLLISCVLQFHAPAAVCILPESTKNTAEKQILHFFRNTIRYWYHYLCNNFCRFLPEIRSEELFIKVHAVFRTDKTLLFSVTSKSAEKNKSLCRGPLYISFMLFPGLICCFVLLVNCSLSTRFALSLYRMVRPDGIEPPTHGLGNHCSIP